MPTFLGQPEDKQAVMETEGKLSEKKTKLCAKFIDSKRAQLSKKERMYVYTWLIHFIVLQKLIQHSKATIPQFKKKKLKRERENRGKCGESVGV